jgi:hypothetical protein
MIELLSYLCILYLLWSSTRNYPQLPPLEDGHGR